MEKQTAIINSELKTIGFRYISNCLHWIDIAVFKIMIDYIVRNFDPTGINIGGLIDSFCSVLIKPKLSSFYKRVKHVISYYHESVIHLRKSSVETILYATKALCYKHGGVKK
ncbi:hypothetical protein [Mucilaginibacter sp.]|uniref:hypothetical protein n=1 Tax=Mucilaginibacter sp. TaxID=1882438 RepID=UPI003D0A52F0